MLFKTQLAFKALGNTNSYMKAHIVVYDYETVRLSMYPLLISEWQAEKR